MKHIQIDRDVLYDLYITQNMSVIEVAKILNVSQFTINDRLKRYGIKKDKDAVRLQKEKTNIEKYGTKYPAQSNIVQEKMKQTNLKRYGCEYATQYDEIKEKIKNTNMEKYGCECPLQNNIVQEKTKQTNLERYGTEYPAQSKEIRDKINLSNLEKYGVGCTLQSEEVREKIKKVNLEKYGVEYPAQSEKIKQKIKQTNLEKYGVKCTLELEEVKQKIKQTNLEKYGVENPLQSEQIRRKVEKTILEKYGAENPSKSKEIYGKVKKTNLEKYGVEYTLQSEQIREKAKKTNLDRYGVENPAQAEEIKNKAKASLLNNNFPNVIKYFADKETTEDFLKKNYNEKTTVIQLSKDTGVSIATIGRYIHKYGLEDYIDYSSTVSQPEKDIVEYLTSKGITNIVQSDRDILDGKEIDIYLPDYKVGIEFNGDYWHSELKRDKRYHYDKSILANSKGIFLYHIFSHEWADEEKRIRILNHLDNILHLNENKIYARKCMISEVDVTEKNNFLNENHIQGKDNSTIKLGLYYNDELVSLMTFCKPRFSKKYTWELSRFCSKHNYNVIGGASKLFKYFVDNYIKDGEVIVSYSDIAKTTGKIYKTLNFEFVNDAEPNYIWWRSDDDYKTRYQCQMVNERIIMESNGYIKIYDCGNKVWVFIK